MHILFLFISIRRCLTHHLRPSAHWEWFSAFFFVARAHWIYLRKAEWGNGKNPEYAVSQTVWWQVNDLISLWASVSSPVKSECESQQYKVVDVYKCQAQYLVHGRYLGNVTRCKRDRKIIPSSSVGTLWRHFPSRQTSGWCSLGPTLPSCLLEVHVPLATLISKGCFASILPSWEQPSAAFPFMSLRNLNGQVREGRVTF